MFREEAIGPFLVRLEPIWRIVDAIVDIVNAILLERLRVSGAWKSTLNVIVIGLKILDT
jgi:hypothetical protein